jgi:polyketide cyclase/dehydrase/lipid transport protein
MLSYEASGVARAAPEDVWAAWVDVASWSESEHIESARLDGEFRPGGTIASKAKGFPRSTLTITRVEPPRLWVDESRSPGIQMTFEHVIEPGEEGTELTERVLIRGPLARLVGVLMRRKLEALFAASVAHVGRRAEQAVKPRGTAPVEREPT